jgi:hypothetical protein
LRDREVEIDHGELLSEAFVEFGEGDGVGHGREKVRRCEVAKVWELG